MIIALLVLLSLVFLLKFLFYIPSYKEHIERNKHNRMPKGSLKIINVSKDLFQDDAGIFKKWVLFTKFQTK